MEYYNNGILMRWLDVREFSKYSKKVSEIKVNNNIELIKELINKVSDNRVKNRFDDKYKQSVKDQHSKQQAKIKEAVTKTNPTKGIWSIKL